MQPVGGRGPARERIDQHQMDVACQQVASLLDKLARARGRVLASGRDDLDHGDDTVATGMTNDDAALSGAKRVVVGFLKQAGPGRREDSGRTGGFGDTLGCTMRQRKDTGDERAGPLLREAVVING